MNPTSARAAPCYRLLTAGLGLAAAFLLSPAQVHASATGLPTGFSDSLLAGGMSNPTAMAFSPDGRLFVCQQDGRIRVVKDGSLITEPFLAVTVNSTGERGLLGIAFDPGFAANRFLYAYYTATSPSVHNRLSRFTADGADPDRVEAGSETALLELPGLGATNHNGGAIHFGPDGMLYVAVGENAVTANAQSMGTILGKILRIRPDGTIPEDNPFYNSASGVNRLIWALGLRNPFTFAFEPGTGRLFLNDVGSGSWEEVDEGFPGANFGWADTEGPFDQGAWPAYTRPLYYYSSQGAVPECAITGGTFYGPPASLYPASYAGKYFFADYCAGWVRYLDPPAAGATLAPGAFTQLAAGYDFPVDLKVGPDGALYVLQRGGGGQVYRIGYSAGTATSTPTSTGTATLTHTATGTFTATPTPSPTETSSGTQTAVATNTPTPSPTSTETPVAASPTWTFTPHTSFIVPHPPCVPLSASPPYPNPLRDAGASFRIDLEANCPKKFRWTLFTVSGRNLAGGEGEVPKGGAWTWEPSDGEGNPLGNGTYLLWIKPDGEPGLLRTLLVLR